jgi:hypothetical protein
MGLLDKIADIEKEMGRTQKNKGVFAATVVLTSCDRVSSSGSLRFEARVCLDAVWCSESFIISL